MNEVRSWGPWGVRRKTYTMPRGASPSSPGAVFGGAYSGAGYGTPVHVPTPFGAYGRPLYGGSWTDYIPGYSTAQKVAETIQDSLPGAEINKRIGIIENMLDWVNAGAATSIGLWQSGSAYPEFRTPGDNAIGVMLRVSFFYALGASEALFNKDVASANQLALRSRETLKTVKAMVPTLTVIRSIRGSWTVGPSVFKAWRHLKKAGAADAAAGLYSVEKGAIMGYVGRVGGAVAVTGAIGYGLYRMAT